LKSKRDHFWGRVSYRWCHFETPDLLKVPNFAILTFAILHFYSQNRLFWTRAMAKIEPFSNERHFWAPKSSILNERAQNVDIWRRQPTLRMKIASFHRREGTQKSHFENVPISPYSDGEVHFVAARARCALFPSFQKCRFWVPKIAIFPFGEVSKKCNFSILRL